MKKTISTLLSILLFSLNVFALEPSSKAGQTPSEQASSAPVQDGVFAVLEPSYGVDLPPEDGIVGSWFAIVGGHGIFRKAELEITKDKRMYYAVLKGMDDTVEKISVTSIDFEENTLKFKIIDYAAEYRGVLGEDGIIRGNLVWEGMGFGVNFSRAEIARPQEPAKTSAGSAAKAVKFESKEYLQEDVKFLNQKAGITLAATLTMPYGSKAEGFPAVVLISDNGPQNRDEEMYGHKPFLVISDYLTKNGIAVLRYDDRGTGESSGSFQGYTTEDFASDASAAIEYLKTRKEIDPTNIGLIGHGEGAVIASMITAKDRRIMFIVLLAGHAVSGKEVILKQKEMTGKAAKIKSRVLKSEIAITKKVMEIVADQENSGKQRSMLTEYLSTTYDNFMPDEIPKGVGKADFMRSYINTYSDTWMRKYLKYNPSSALENVKCPVLALWGNKDLQISAKDNSKALKLALDKSGNRDVTVKTYAKLNHMFQESKTGLPSEYQLTEQTIAPEVLEDVLKWIKGRIVTKTVNN